VDEALDEVSATDVRSRVRKGHPWEHLVPEQIYDQVRTVYS
jgi:nicotinic acid mononucleotide adenylyltransferase